MSKLAIDGGEPVRKDPWPARLQIDDREIEAVMELMEAARSGGAFDRYGGEQVDAYEQEFAAAFDVKFATGTGQGTGAIHAALGALRLEPGSEVISAPITDQGAIMPVVDLNCIPIFADAWPECMNMHPDSIRRKITDRTRAIVCGHIAGIPCQMDEIMQIAEEHDLYVVEDCAQAHDAIYHGEKCGAIGHMAAFSLMSGKHTTSGGQGGMVLTDDEELYWNAKRFADRGKPFNSDVGSNLFLGLNYRMTELEACIGRVQLQKMEGIADARRAFVSRLAEEIADLETVRVCWYPEDSQPAWWFLLIRIYAEKLSVDKAQFAAAVAAEGIPMGAGYGAVATRAYWLQNQCAFGRESHFPWDTLWEGGAEGAGSGRLRTHGDWEAELQVPGAEAADANHMRMSVHECVTELEALDTAAALRKVEAAYKR